MAGDRTWDTVLQRLLTSADAAGQIDWAVSVDSTIARAHQHAPHITRPTGAGPNYTDLRSEPPDHAIGRSRGGWSTKVHHLVDGSGRPLVALVGPGQAGDAPMFPRLMRHLRVARAGRGRTRTRPDRVRGDKAYSSRAIREHLRARGIVAAVPVVAARQRLIPSATAAAMSLNDASTCSGNGALWPPAMTNSPSSTAPQSSSAP